MTTRTERQAHIEKWEKSGKSKKAYAESAGIKYATFIYWFGAERRSPEEPGRFIRLGREPMPSGLEVRLANGIRLYLDGPLSAGLLKMLSDV